MTIFVGKSVKSQILVGLKTSYVSLSHFWSRPGPDHWIGNLILPQLYVKTIFVAFKLWNLDHIVFKLVLTKQKILSPPPFF